MPQNSTTLCVYQDIAKTTHRMLSHAKASQWDQVIALTPLYQRAVEKLHGTNIQLQHDLDARRHLLSEILDNDAEIRRLASPELERLNRLISGLKRQRIVLQTYYTPQP